MSENLLPLAGAGTVARRTFIGYALAAAWALAAALSLSACAASGEPYYCQQGIGERALTGYGGNPLLLGPALLVSVGMEAFCDDDSARSPAVSTVSPSTVPPAERWATLCKQAHAGDPAARSALGWHYRLGWQPVERDLVEAYKWFTLAEQVDYEDAASYRELVKAQMAPKDIARAEKLTAEWRPSPQGCDDEIKSASATD